MADAVTSQTLADGQRTAVFKFTNISDGTGESGVTKLTFRLSQPFLMVVLALVSQSTRFGGNATE
jgi:hypothetical protein